MNSHLEGLTCVFNPPFEVIDRVRILLAPKEASVPLVGKPDCFLKNLLELTAPLLSQG